MSMNYRRWVETTLHLRKMYMPMRSAQQHAGFYSTAHSGYMYPVQVVYHVRQQPSPPPQYVHRMRLVREEPPRQRAAPLHGSPVHVRVGAAFSPEWTRRTVATAQRASTAPPSATHGARIKRAAALGLGEENSVWRDDKRSDNQVCTNFGQKYRADKPGPPQWRWPRCLRGELRLAADTWGA